MMIRSTVLIMTLFVGLLSCKASIGEGVAGTREYEMLDGEKISNECRNFIGNHLEPFLEKIIKSDYDAIRAMMRSDGRGFANASDIGGYEFAYGPAEDANNYKWKSFMMELTNQRLWGDGETLRDAIMKARKIKISNLSDKDYRGFGARISGKKEYVLQFLQNGMSFYFNYYYIAKRVNGVDDMLHRDGVEIRRR